MIWLAMALAAALGYCVGVYTGANAVSPRRQISERALRDAINDDWMREWRSR